MRGPALPPARVTRAHPAARPSTNVVSAECWMCLLLSASENYQYVCFSLGLGCQSQVLGVSFPPLSAKQSCSLTPALLRASGHQPGQGQAGMRPQQTRARLSVVSPVYTVFPGSPLILAWTKRCRLGQASSKRTSWPSRGPLNHQAGLFFHCQGVSGCGESRPSWINGLVVRRWEEACRLLAGKTVVLTVGG